MVTRSIGLKISRTKLNIGEKSQNLLFTLFTLLYSEPYVKSEWQKVLIIEKEVTRRSYDLRV